jgi:hypothetical protein
VRGVILVSLENASFHGPCPEITNISFLAKLFFKTFISLKHLSDYRTVGLSDCRIIATAPMYTTLKIILHFFPDFLGFYYIYLTVTACRKKKFCNWL